MSQNLKVKIEKIAKTESLLNSEEGVELFWPNSKLPGGAKEGDTFYLTLLKTPESGDNKNLAKAVLTEIIGEGGEDEEIK